MARRRVFSTYRPASVEPIELVLNEEVFHFRGTITGVEMLEFASGVASESMVESASAISLVFKETIVEEDRDAFNKYIRDTKNHVDFNTLLEIGAWLIEEYTNHPTEQSADSSAGSTPNGPGLTAVPSSDTGSTFEN